MSEKVLISPREVPPTFQGMMIAGRCPGAQITVTESLLAARFTLKPLALGRKYLVEVTHLRGEQPRAFVRFPRLSELVPGRTIPHLWSQKQGELCLFYNPLSEWRPGLLLADSIVPWASEWLYHFEHWEISDEWDGGGTVH
jgi:hypothetical protein